MSNRKATWPNGVKVKPPNGNIRMDSFSKSDNKSYDIVMGMMWAFIVGLVAGASIVKLFFI